MALTLRELEMMTCDVISVKQAAEVLRCAPQVLRDSLDLDDERPPEQKRFLFPHCKIGCRHHIARIGFIRWMRGELAIWDMYKERTAGAGTPNGS